MGKSLSFPQRLALKAAWKQGEKASRALSNEEAKGYLFLLPPKISLIAPYVEPLRDWLGETPRGTVYIAAPEMAGDMLNLTYEDVTVVTFNEDDMKRNELPTKALQERISRIKPEIAVLPVSEIHPLCEVLFALVPARLKAAIRHPLREKYVNFLVHPDEKSEPEHASRVLLNYLTKFIRTDVAV